MKQSRGREKNAAIPESEALARNGGKTDREPKSFKKDGEIENAGKVEGKVPGGSTYPA